jgi:radical SAM superfamily enzyme YgiQ (UPF0313 family)
MYRSKQYRERSFIDIKKDLQNSHSYFLKTGQFPSRIFLCDGDALGASMDLLIPTLELINELFPELDRVGIYATAQNMLDKSEEDLRQLVSLKLNMAYLGLESGNDAILKMIVKKNTRQDMIEGSKKLIRSGFKLSIIAMLGIGGKKLSAEHIVDTASIVSDISPHYFSFLTTIAIPGTPYFKMVERGLIEPLTSKELLVEMRDVLDQINPSRNILFRANHVSNQYPLGGSLSRDRKLLVKTVHKWMVNTPEGVFPPVPASM